MSNEACGVRSGKQPEEASGLLFKNEEHDPGGKVRLEALRAMW